MTSTGQTWSCAECLRPQPVTSSWRPVAVAAVVIAYGEGGQSVGCCEEHRPKIGDTLPRIDGRGRFVVEDIREVRP
jgi:hypothetical protein